MFAVITSPRFWTDIQEVIARQEGDILYKCVDKDIDIISELDKISSTISTKYLIVDISVALDESKVVQALRRYRIKKNDTQIIIIAPNCLQGNKLISDIVTMSIHDIINPAITEDSTDSIVNDLLEKIKSPSTYAQAVKWDVGANQDEVQPTTKNHKVVKEKEVVERTVTIIKDKIIGTVIIALTGAMERIGTTHNSIAIAKFLHQQGFKVAVIEYHESNTFRFIKDAYEDVQVKHNKFILDEITFYPYNEEISVSDILQENYNYIILDMGQYETCDMNEFKRADLKIVVAGVKDWEIHKLAEIIHGQDNYISKYNYLFNFCDAHTLEFVRNNMDSLKTYKAEYSPNPLSVTKEYSNSIKILLKDILPEQSTKNKAKKSLADTLKIFKRGE